MSQDQVWRAVVRQAMEGVAELRRVRDEDDLMDTIFIQQTSAILLLVDVHNFSDTTALLEFIKKWKSRVAIVVAASAPSWRDARELILSGALDYIRKSEIVDDIRVKLMALMYKVKT